MAIKDIYNSIGKTIKKTTQSISDFLPKNEVSYTAPSTPIAPTPSVYSLKNRGVNLTDSDFNAVRPLIYGEVSNRAPNKQELESHVILNTALNRMKEYAARGQNKSLAEVIAMPNQYQAYGGKQYKAYSNATDTPSLSKKKQVDMILDKIKGQIQTGNYPDNTQGAYFYIHNPDGTITYDNKRPLFAK